MSSDDHKEEVDEEEAEELKDFDKHKFELTHNLDMDKIPQNA